MRFVLSGEMMLWELRFLFLLMEKLIQVDRKWAEVADAVVGIRDLRAPTINTSEH